MEIVELMKGVYWVGAVDWNIRDFHGYSTPTGTTYNAYLILDEKNVLVDTVKAPFYLEMLGRISEIIDPAKINMVISNHVEMDHSGSLSQVVERIGNPVVVTSERGKKGLEKHYPKSFNFKIVKTGDALSIGRRTLAFVEAPMLHWPDSMFTYIQEDRLLLPNDAFGQHLATSERFADEVNQLGFGIAPILFPPFRSAVNFRPFNCSRQGNDYSTSSLSSMPWTKRRLSGCVASRPTPTSGSARIRRPP